MFSLSFSGKVLARALPQTNAFCEIFVFSVDCLIKDGGGHRVTHLRSRTSRVYENHQNCSCFVIFPEKNNELQMGESLGGDQDLLLQKLSSGQIWGSRKLDLKVCLLPLFDKRSQSVFTHLRLTVATSRHAKQCFLQK